MVVRRPPAGCREELLDPPDLALMTVAACSMFRKKAIRPLDFSRRGEFIGERAASEGGPAGLTMWWRGWAAPLYGEPPPSHLRSSRSFSKNRRFGFCFV
jgi:hypothetical protein